MELEWVGRPFILFHFFWLNSKLGAITNWGLEIEKKCYQSK
jgi:hypothetical protein